MADSIRFQTTGSASFRLGLSMSVGEESGIEVYGSRCGIYRQLLQMFAWIFMNVLTKLATTAHWTTLIPTVSSRTSKQKTHKNRHFPWVCWCFVGDSLARAHVSNHSKPSLLLKLNSTILRHAKFVLNVNWNLVFITTWSNKNDEMWCIGEECNDHRLVRWSGKLQVHVIQMIQVHQRSILDLFGHGSSLRSSLEREYIVIYSIGSY